jgi:hypothetical protein
LKTSPPRTSAEAPATPYHSACWLCRS